MLQALPVALTLHTIGLTMVSTVDILRRYEAVLFFIKRVQCLSERALAFTISGRDGE